MSVKFITFTGMSYFDLSMIDPLRHTRVREHLLWEFAPETFDYQKSRSIVVERVVQRGDTDDWLTVFNLYEGVREQIKQLPYLNDRDMNFVRVVLEIPLTELKCYTGRRFPEQHWKS